MKKERNPRVEIPLIRKFATFGTVELLPILHLERPLLNIVGIGILLENLNPPLVRACIVNVHPIRQDYLPTDYDGVVDRKNDLTYHDRTLFDERMAMMITDYVRIIKSLIKLAKDNKIRKTLVDNILQQQALTRNFMTGKQWVHMGISLKIWYLSTL